MNTNKQSLRVSEASFVDATKRLLINLGAAAASNNAEAFERCESALQDANVPPEKMQHAVEIGTGVRRNALKHTNSLADRLTGTTSSSTTALDSIANIAVAKGLCPKSTLLVAVAAAMAAPCEVCLRSILPKMHKVGLEEADINSAIELGKKAQAATIDGRRDDGEVVCTDECTDDCTDDCTHDDSVRQSAACGCGC